MDPTDAERQVTASRPARALGFWSATALVIASMLGTGVFTTTGFLLADLHSPWLILAAWLAGGVIALLGALSYGSLAKQIPESGGEYLFLSRTLHPSAGYVAAWISLLVGFSAPLAAAATAFGQYTKDWLPSVPPPVTGTVLLLVTAAIHAWDVKRGALAQNIAVLIKVTLLAVFIALGSSQITLATSTPASPASIADIAMSLVWISFSYSGWNAVIYVGGEVARPERNLPRSLLAGTLCVVVLYLATNAVFLLAVPAEVLSGRLEVGRLAAAHLGGSGWANATTLLISLALLTSVSSLLMAGPRVYSRVAADGYLPAWLATKSGPPRPAILLQLALALAMLWTATYQTLLSFIGFTLGLSTALTVGGLMLLRHRLGAALPVPGWPWVPAAFVLAVLAMTSLSVARAPLPSLAGLATLGIGWLLWRLTRNTAAPR